MCFHFWKRERERWKPVCCRKQRGSNISTRNNSRNLEKLMEKRDKELEMDNNYIHKLWNDSLDQVNSNLVNIHNVLIELEGSVNNLGSRQDHLVTLVEYTNDYCLFNREEPPAKVKPDISIPKFPPSLTAFNLEPPNLKTSKSYKRRR